MTPRNVFRGLAATAAAVVFAAAGGSTALADLLEDNVSASSSVDLQVGGPDGAAEFWVNPTGSCDINATTGNLVVNVVVSNIAVATVSPSQLTFTECNQHKAIAITAVGVGSADVTLTRRTEPTGGQFNYNTAKVDVKVTAGVVKTATTTTVTCPTSVPYTGSGATPCTATVTGTGGFSESLAVSYTANTNAGTATASAAYAGSSTRLPSSASATFLVTKASSTTTVTCPSSVAYDGSAKTPCSASVTGAGGLSATLTPTYVDNTAAGTATASAAFGGDANHDGSSASASFEISRATSSVTVTCGAGPFTFTGDPQTPCTARATGANGLDVDVPVTYEDNTDAGTATASATYAGDANHTGGTDTETFDIGQADALCTVTGYSGTYDGNAHGATGACTGVDGKSLTGLDLGDSFTGAGDHTATWTFEGGTNYADENGTVTVSLAKAPTTTVVSCPVSVVYDGSAQEPCTAKVTGAGGLEQSLSVSHTDNTNAGTATAAASYGGGVNHLGSSDSKAFEITKATTTTEVTCPAGPFVYTGSAITPACTASTTGAGGLSVSPTVTFADNTDAGEATASATYAGDANHTGSSDSATFTIDKARSDITLICTSPVTYTGSALQPCSAKATGAGGLDQELVVGYGSNTNAGTATASASYGGDANHEGSSANTTFTIAKAGSVTTVTCPVSVDWTGSAITPCTAQATGAGMDPVSLPVAYQDNTDAGTAKASASWTGDSNHQGSSASVTFKIASWWTLKGFYAPVDMNGVVNVVKGGSTVPLKFEAFAGATELTSTSAVKSFVQTKVNCDSAATLDEIEVASTGGTSLRYDATGGQFIQNWQTPKTAGACYRVTMTTQDGSSLSALFKLK